MSEEAIARSMIRETKIWSPFSWSYRFNEAETAERTLIYGLYSNAYLNGHTYLRQIDDTELANLLTDYNNKIAQLNNEEQIIVADIVSKRYLAGIDKLIHDQKMITMRAKIDTESNLADARYAALAADQAALTTMAAKVAAEEEKNAARITELQAYIQIEGINLSDVEREIAEKEIQALRVENQKLNTNNEILRLQVQIIQTATELIDIDVRMAGTQVNIAETERSIAKIGLLADDLTLTQAETSIIESQIPIADARITLAQTKYDDIEAEYNYIIDTLMAHEDIIYLNKEALLNLKHMIRENALLHDKQEKLLRNELEIDMSELNVALTEMKENNRTAIDAERIKEIAVRAVSAWTRANAAIDAANTLAAAKITTRLTHLIEKA